MSTDTDDGNEKLYEEISEMMIPEGKIPSNSVSNRRRRLALTAEDTPYDISYHPGKLLFYSPFRQRQKWGDSQVLPRVNWGDLFFDLFYVAATYNVSYILVKSPTMEGILYATGTFFPLMGFWIEKTVFDSRFVNEDDMYHRLHQVCNLVVLAAAVLHIRPVKYMGYPEKDISTFVFCLCLVIDKLLTAFKYIELYFYGVGQASLKVMARRTASRQLIPGSLYAAAMVIAAMEYYSSTYEDKAVRHLATETKMYDENHAPILLCLIGYLVQITVQTIEVVFCFPKGGAHKERMVPMNISFYIHRTGEWVMLMLGECVFSILIVDIPNEDSEYYTTFFESLLTVIFLQYLYFSSQPHDPDHHASRRNKDAGVAVLLIFHIFSFALVSLGAAYTLFLEGFAKEKARRVAEGEADTVDGAAHLYSAMLALVFAALDISTIFHLGIRESQQRCVCAKSRGTNVKGLVLIFIRVGCIIFIATLSQWTQSPKNLVSIGFAMVLCQLTMRKLGVKFLSHEQVDIDPSTKKHEVSNDDHP